jgi:hypothetical protein
MFPCPVNTWGLLEGDHELTARVWDADWACFDLRSSSAEADRVAPSDDPACARLRDASRAVFPLLPNGRPNR